MSSLKRRRPSPAESPEEQFKGKVKDLHIREYLSQIQSSFSKEVIDYCTVAQGDCVMMPFSIGTAFFILMSTFVIVRDLKLELLELGIKVYSPCVTNVELATGVNAYDNRIDILDINDPVFNRIGSLTNILAKIADSEPRKSFCIIPINLFNKHSNTLIIFKDTVDVDNDGTLTGIVVEPHGFLKVPYGEYYEPLCTLLATSGYTISLLNSSGIFFEDTCQARLQNDVEIAISNPNDTLMLTKGMCATLSAKLTMEYIKNIVALKEGDFVKSNFFTCSRITFDDIVELNQSILYYGALIMIQSQDKRQSRSAMSEKKQTEMMFEFLAGTFDPNKNNIKGKVSLRKTGHNMLAKSFIEQVFTEDCKMQITDEGIIDTYPHPGSGRTGGYRKIKRKTKRNRKKSLSKKLSKKYNKPLKRKTKRFKSKSKQNKRKRY